MFDSEVVVVGDRDAGPTCHARVQMIRYDVTTRVCHVNGVTLRLLEPTSSLTQLPNSSTTTAQAVTILRYLYKAIRLFSLTCFIRCCQWAFLEGVIVKINIVIWSENMMSSASQIPGQPELVDGFLVVFDVNPHNVYRPSTSWLLTSSG